MIIWKTPKPPWKGNLQFYYRAENHLKYFARQIYTDRLMICLIVVIVLAIIAIIILKALGKDADVEIDNLKW